MKYNWTWGSTESKLKCFSFFSDKILAMFVHAQINFSCTLIEERNCTGSNNMSLLIWTWGFPKSSLLLISCQTQTCIRQCYTSKSIRSLQSKVFNCYLVVVVRIKNCAVETVWQGVALHILGSVLSSLCGKSADFHNLAKVNLNPLIFIIVLRKPAAAIASYILVTDSGPGGTPILVVLWGGRHCWIGNLVGKLDTKRRGALYLWCRKT